jgi:UDP-GlcNAc:undecaprenyl-phosphate GlcNAc-1-phosphate transferase
LVLGISGCLVFLLVVTSRRDELANLRDDLQDRLTRGRQERQAAKLAWEAIQRLELCTNAPAAYEIVDQTASALGCELVQISCVRHDWPVFNSMQDGLAAAAADAVLGPTIIFRLPGGHGLRITVSLGMRADSPLAADIIFRYLQRLCQALAERLERFRSSEPSARISHREPFEGALKGPKRPSRAALPVLAAADRPANPSDRARG